MGTDKKTQMGTDRGFTLMELLIAVSIFAIIVLCLYSTFSGGIRIWQRQERTFKYSHSVRMALEKMAKELRNTINYSLPEQKGMESEEVQGYKFRGDEKALSFMTIIGGKIAKVDYSFEQFQDKGILRRKAVFQKEGFKEEKQNQEVLIGDLDELSFEYAYKAEEKDSPPVWQNSWQKESKEDKVNIPIGIRVTLEFKEPTQKEKEIFRKTLFIPTGALEEHRGL